MSKKVILTGLRANNDLHIGNYLGALLPIVDIANEHADKFQINLFIPDLHSFTTPIDHSKLQSAIAKSLRVFVAAGMPLEHPNVNLYRQSYIPAHSELAWILNCFTGFGELSRMTEFKDKSKRLGVEHIGVGQFDYPPLMAADILLYGATLVPVGEDQTQHLEFTRVIAQRMNNRFGEILVVPKPVKFQHEFFGKDQGLRIKDLVDPTKKMSKSDESDKGIIFLTDSIESAKKKIIGATTDSLGRVAYNRAEQPGLANLIDLLALMSNKSVSEVCKQFVGQSQYGPLKESVAEVVCQFLTKFHAKLAKVDDKAIQKKLRSSEKAMNVQANKTLLKIQRAIGLRPEST